MNDTTKRADIAADITNSVLTFTFANGNEVVMNADDLSADIRHAAMMHGLKQKIGDAAAIARSTETGKSATLDDKHNAMHNVCARLLAGQWNAPKGGGEMSGAGLLLRALLIHMGATPGDAAAIAKVKAFLEGKSKEEQAALRRNPKIAAIMDSIRAAQAKSAKVDSEALLDELAADAE